MRNLRMLRVRAENKAKLDDRNPDERGKRHLHTTLCAMIAYLLSPNRGLMMTRLLLGHGDRIQRTTFHRLDLRTSMRSTDREGV